MPRADPHSYADTSQPQARSIDLSLRVDFEERVLEGEAALHFREPGAGPLDLDTRDLRIESVAGLDGAPLACALAAAEPVLGSRLRIQLPAGSRGVRIRYRTSPQATALQWLTIFDGGVPPRLVNPDAWPRYADRFADLLGFRPADLAKTRE